MTQRAFVTALGMLATLVCAAQQVDFPDPNLEDAVREALNIPTGPIYQESMFALTSLSAERRGISDLTGLEYAVDLNDLNVAGNSITELNPLAGLTTLTALILYDNTIGDLLPLGGLIDLNVLDIDNNSIDDITPLQNLFALRWLDLRENSISSITPLQNLTALTFLDVSANPISTLTPLAALTSLETLRFSNTSATSLAPLQNLTSLATLEAGYIGITDLSPLANLTNVIDLNLAVNSISDLTPLAGITGISRLILNGNAISNLAPLESLVALSELRLHNNQITDVASLADNTGLGTGDIVSIEGNALTQKTLCEDIPVLQSCGASLTFDGTCTSTPVVFNDDNLEAAVRSTLDITGTIYDSDMLALTDLTGTGSTISDLTGLETAVNLERLYLGANGIADLSPIAGLTRLTWLEIYSNDIVDLSPLAGLTGLTALYLFDNDIVNVSPLAGLANLVYLDLSSNLISQLTPLASLAAIQELSLQFNSIVDLTPLAGLTTLTDLRLDANGISAVDPLAGLINLGMLELSDNSITDIAPLVANPGLGAGDALYLRGNPLSERALCEQIPALAERSFLNLQYDGTCDPAVIDVAPSSANVAAAGDSVWFEISNTGTGPMPWTATVTAGSDWLTPSPATGEDVGFMTVHVAQNPTPDARHGTIDIHAEQALNSPVTITITQEGAIVPVLSIEPTRVDFGPAAGAAQLAVTNAGAGTLEWDVSVILGSGWLQAYVAKNIGDGTIQVECDANSGGTQRVGRILVTALEGTENSPAMIPVVQQGSDGAGGPTIVISTPSTALTNTGPVTFAITYLGASSVALTAGDIRLETSGTATGTVSVVNGTTTTPAVIVNDIIGDGTLAISILPGTAADAMGTPDDGAGPSETVRVDNTPPLISFGLPEPTSTTMGPVTYEVRYFGASSVDLTVSDVFILATGTAECTYFVTGGTTATPTVTLTEILGEGTLAIRVGAGTATDAAGNVAGATGPSAAVTVTAPTGPIEFTDPRLEEVVREHLSIPDAPIYEQDLALLIRLEAAGRGIQSLGGLEHARSLAIVNVAYNQLVDVAPLVANAGFGEGDFVALYGNRLTQETICNDLPALQDRGVRVGYNAVCGGLLGRIVGFVEDSAPPYDVVSCAAVLVLEDDEAVGIAVVDAGGYYKISRLIQGATYKLVFIAPGYTPVTQFHTLASFEDEVSVSMELSPLAVLRGVVVDNTFERRMVPGALVVARYQGQIIGRTITCASGRFEFGQLPLPKQGSVTLEFSAPGYGTQAVTAVPGPDELEVAIPKLNLPGSIIGIVADESGSAISQAEVLVQQVPAGFSAVRTTAGDGGYAVANVPDGEYEARAVMKNVGWGLNSGSVAQDLVAIDIELLHGDVPCAAPSAPTGLAASDGTASDAVELIWDTVVGDAIEYQVLRSTTATAGSATDVSGWIAGTTFRDTSAAAPGTGSGCSGGSGITYTTYYYWVRAREAGATCTSAYSTSETGYRGSGGKHFEAAAVARANLSATALYTLLALLLVFNPRRRGYRRP